MLKFRTMLPNRDDACFSPLTALGRGR